MSIIIRRFLVYILEKFNFVFMTFFNLRQSTPKKTSNTWVFLHSFLHKHLLLGCKLGQQLLLTFPGQFSSELQNTNSDKNFRKECYSFLLWFHQLPEWYSDYTLNNTSSQNHNSRTYFSNKRLTKRCFKFCVSWCNFPSSGQTDREGGVDNVQSTGFGSKRIVVTNPILLIPRVSTTFAVTSSYWWTLRRKFKGKQRPIIITQYRQQCLQKNCPHSCNI